MICLAASETRVSAFVGTFCSRPPTAFTSVLFRVLYASSSNPSPAFAVTKRSRTPKPLSVDVEFIFYDSIFFLREAAVFLTEFEKGTCKGRLKIDYALSSLRGALDALRVLHKFQGRPTLLESFGRTLESLANSGLAWANARHGLQVGHAITASPSFLLRTRPTATSVSMICGRRFFH